MKSQKRLSAATLTLGAALTALVIVLQFLAIFVKTLFPLLPFTVSLVLIPIVIGAAKSGPYMGGWLGLVFGITVLLSGDAAAFFVIHPIGTVLTVLIKGVACGFLAGLVYKLLEKKNKTLAVFVAAVVCPLVNTGLFFVGCLLFFMETVAGWATAAGFGGNVAAYMFLGLAGVNFLFEVGSNLLLSPAAVRILNAKMK